MKLSWQPLMASYPQSLDSLLKSTHSIVCQQNKALRKRENAPPWTPTK